MSKGKIMIIDDDPGFLELMRDYFKPLHYEVRIIDNLEDAIHQFRRDRPGVVLLDFNMPLVTGEKFLQLLQGIDPMIRVIVITGHIPEEVEEKFKGLGYFAFFIKSDLSLEKVKEKVDEALSY